VGWSGAAGRRGDYCSSIRLPIRPTIGATEQADTQIFGKSKFGGPNFLASCVSENLLLLLRN